MVAGLDGTRHFLGLVYCHVRPDVLLAGFKLSLHVPYQINQLDIEKKRLGCLLLSCWGDSNAGSSSTGARSVGVRI